MESIDLSNTPVARWISKEQRGISMLVQNVRNVSPDKKKLDLELYLEDREGNLYRFSLWGKNLVYMINTFGMRTDLWKNCSIRVNFEDVDGKTHRIIERA